jgi:protein-tyrosine phosphatase
MKENLDYTNADAAVNFRDVGEFINLIAGQHILPEKHIYRGGTIKSIFDPAVIGDPKTIFNLQKGPDHYLSGIRNIHFPISNDHEKYHTAEPEVRKWLREIVGTIDKGITFPLYVHCLSGRDRTGVVIAVLLTICGVDSSHIIEEYHLSIGTERRNHIHIALEGFSELNSYFNGINLAKVEASLQQKTIVEQGAATDAVELLR